MLGDLRFILLGRFVSKWKAPPTKTGPAQEIATPTYPQANFHIDHPDAMQLEANLVPGAESVGRFLKRCVGTSVRCVYLRVRSVDWVGGWDLVGGKPPIQIINLAVGCPFEINQKQGPFFPWPLGFRVCSTE